MGGMETWTWGEAYPGFMDALVPMASQPTAMASRNWMMRRMIVDSIRKDPAWKGGNYTEQPPILRYANVFFGIATSGGTLGYQKLAPTHEAADRLVDEREAAPFTADANDFLYQWDASRDFDAMPKLDAITAPVLVINSADDERNPPEIGPDRGGGAQTQGRQAVSDPGERGHARAWDHGHGAVLHRAAGDVPERGAEAGDVIRPKPLKRAAHQRNHSRAAPTVRRRKQCSAWSLTRPEACMKA